MQISLLFALALGFMGLSIMLPALANRKKAARYNAWPEITGEVISSTVNNQAVPTANKTEYMDVMVRYQYRSGGQLRFDSQMIGTFPKAREEAARQSAAHYVPGEALLIYCDPLDANHSLIIKPVIHWMPSFIGGCILLGIAILFVLVQLAFAI